jgi:hypothetical protein
MATTDFIQFNPAAINQESDAQYLADSQRAGGYGVNNPVPSPLLNKFSYQASTFCAAFCQMMAAKGYSTSDADVNVLAAVLANVITDADLEPNVMVVGYSPTPAFNAADANGFQMTLAGNITASSISGVSPGQLIAFYFAQDATGGRTVSWPSGFVGALQPDPAANAVSVQMFRADLSSVPRAVTDMVSNNGIFTGAMNATSLTTTGLVNADSLAVAGAAPSGMVLTGNGTSYVPASPVVYNPTMNIVTGLRSFGTIYQNTTPWPMTVSVSGYITYGVGNQATIQASVGAYPPTSSVATGSITNSSGATNITFIVPSGSYYVVRTAISFPGQNQNALLYSWTEWA